MYYYANSELCSEIPLLPSLCLEASKVPTEKKYKRKTDDEKFLPGKEACRMPGSPKHDHVY